MENDSQNEMPDLQNESASHGPEKHLIAVASNPQQMQVAQHQLVTWTDKRMEMIAAERDEAFKNLEIAKKNKWRHSPFQRQHNKLVEQYEFYEKLKCALEAGYTIIPNFSDIDVFAVRTARDRPTKNWVSQDALHGTVIPNDQRSECPPAGEGDFVNATAQYTQRKIHSHRDKNNNDHYLQQAWATNHDIVGFPFKVVKPEILIATKKAMDFLFFDDVGCVPGRQRKRRGDPMIIGRIHCHPHTHKKWGNGRVEYEKTISFLITWFIDTKEL
jgi:hypothetical protein